MEYKIGQKVRVRRDLEEDITYGECWTAREMTKFAGKVVEIINTENGHYKIKEDNEAWHWDEDMLESLEYTYKNLRKSPVGTKITFENGKIAVKTENEYWQSSNIGFDTYSIEDFRVYTLGKIIKIEEPTYSTVYEVKPEVLDEVEKAYLSAVIKPFRDRVKHIKKVGYEDRQYIIIGVDSDDSFGLPSFKADAMYKGMELNKKYSLMELGL